MIFTSVRTDRERGHGKMAERMMVLAAEQPGFLGVENVRDADGPGITASYRTSEDAIKNWKADAEHCVAQEAGIKTWY